jgi:hypothetical protein
MGRCESCETVKIAEKSTKAAREKRLSEIDEFWKNIDS